MRPTRIPIDLAHGSTTSLLDVVFSACIRSDHHALETKNLITLFISCTAIAFGQSADYGFPGQRIGPAEGLTATDIYCIQEDDQSRMFVGTDKGQFITEGNTIEQFSVEDGLVDNTIFKLYLDPSNRIWALTYSGGVCYFEEGQWKIPLGMRS